MDVRYSRRRLLSLFPTLKLSSHFNKNDALRVYVLFFKQEVLWRFELRGLLAVIIAHVVVEILFYAWRVASSQNFVETFADMISCGVSLAPTNYLVFQMEKG